MRDLRRRLGRIEAGMADGNEPPPYGLASLLAWGKSHQDRWGDEEERDWASLRHAPGLTGLLARHYLGDDDES